MAALWENGYHTAVTDRGRRIHLFTMPSAALPREMLDGMESEMAQEWGASMRVIRSSAPDPRSDCHGWIFAKGRWWVLGQDVEVILQDNGYSMTADPSAGDLVVYRHEATPITHTGVVYAVGKGRQILVESKWAWLGTYIHPVESQPYGGHPTFYRSARSGHRLKIVPTEPSIPEALVAE